jgi:hypothetical protein
MAKSLAVSPTYDRAQGGIENADEEQKGRCHLSEQKNENRPGS